MRLQDYFKKKCIIKKEFAEKIGKHRETIHNFLRGEKLSLETAVRIEVATNGEVTCRELLKPEVLEKIEKEVIPLD